MTRYFRVLLLLLLCLYSANLYGQNSTADCDGAIPVCTPVYIQTVSSVGTGNVVDLTPANQGCLATGERITTWYIINVVTSGLLEFNLIPGSPNDYDFAVWNVTPRGCGQDPCTIVQDTLPVRCNYSGTPVNTGLSSTIVSGTYEPAINAVAGESYMIVVDNFSLSTIGYTLDFTPSTVSITDTTKPLFKTVATSCGISSNELIITMKEPVLCNSIAPDGSDFYLTTGAGAPVGITTTAAVSQNCLGGGNFSNTINLGLSSALPAGNYLLHANVGTDANTLSDNCLNLQPTTDVAPFTVLTDPSPLGVLMMDTPACIKTRLILTRPIRCTTVATDGSDFTISGSSEVKVIQANPINCTNIPAGCRSAVDISDTIILEFDQSIRLPGVYSVTIGTGTDTNAIYDTCGSLLAPFSFVVSEDGYVKVDNKDPLIVCNPEYITLSASYLQPSSAIMPGFRWSGPNLRDSTIQFPTAYIDSSAQYVVEIMDTNFCYRRARLNVIVPIRNPQLLSRDTAICIGDYVPLLIAGGVDYYWYPGTGLSCTNCANPNASPTVKTTYYGIIFDQYGCSDTVSTTIDVNPLPVVSINKDRDTGVIYARSVKLFALALGGKFYTWEPVRGLSNANIPNPIATPPIKTLYTVFVTDTNQCKATANIEVDVNRTVPVSIPTGFTPNGDGRNDVFRITNLTFQRVTEFRVYNRWGEQVFSSNENNGWDGTYKGTPQEAGVFKYLIRVAYPDSHTEMFKGDVTLIR